ncbi:60S ribosomal protein L5-like [Trifolium pratense]|uniref:60S ribosomal protein L5-like n=1 Tax=Trifolium pratense TaxID=57577 RepID=UPI001E691DE0|nr:60S ribosomal protein L5-like [Trifolium pratense]
MNIYQVRKNTHLVAVYYNNGKLNLFRIHVDVTLADLKHQLSQLNGCLNCSDARRVADVEYRCPSIFLDGSVLCTNMKLQNDGNEKKELDAEVQRKYIFGGHVSSYMKVLMEDEPEKYKSHFSEYIKHGIDSTTKEPQCKR